MPYKPYVHSHLPKSPFTERNRTNLCGVLRESFFHFRLVIELYWFQRTKRALSKHSQIEGIFLVASQVFVRFSLQTLGLFSVFTITDFFALQIPRNLRLTYLHAYQSYVWNTMVSKRIARYGLQPVVGDLVYPREEEVEEELEDAADGESGTVAEDDKMEDAKEKKKVQPLVLDESNVGNYNMYDVVLPLPGYDVIYPANEVAQWYNEQLETDEMSGFKQNVK